MKGEEDFDTEAQSPFHISEKFQTLFTIDPSKRTQGLTHYV